MLFFIRMQNEVVECERTAGEDCEAVVTVKEMLHHADTDADTTP